VRERLREIAQEPLRIRIIFFRKKAEIIADV
jgi:hypothetical protein